MEETPYMIPTSVKEVEQLGWDYIDVIIFTGDAFVDHPSFGTAVIARWLQKNGYRVAVVPQPNWRDDLRDFRKLGAPRLYFAVNSGAMDSMVNHYTASKRLRSDDAYTPEGRAGARPDYAVTVYTKILKKLFPDIPVVIGGIEASLRRLTHYDYWADRLFPSILVDSGADWLCYGMGERPMLELTRAIEAGRNASDIRKIPQIAFRMSGRSKLSDAVYIHSYEVCLKDKKAFAENFALFETAANMMTPPVLIEPVGDGYVQVNPPYPPASEAEMDSFWDLPYTKLPHPRYKGKRIPAYDMIKFSITTHRGCFGGCSFCTIAAHQGKFIQSRTEDSIVKEVRALNDLPGFAGNISDVGAPTANMYGMKGRDASLCAVCRRQSCLFQSPCRNMDRSHARLLALYERIAAVKGIRHAYIGSGIRYDLFLDEKKGFVDGTSEPYFRELVLKHTSGRLKVAPEHTEDSVLKLMGKPSFRLFDRLRREFDNVCRSAGSKCELVPYFISAHPGCGMREMEALSRNPALKGLYMDQVQDFTPTPMTTSSVMFYTGLDPKTLKPV
ncbi:MAG: YgiQ family radical SAM protein, partial [Bacteroidales bacterium]|nr:YgiQ family radical SAM protein [Bacteroidales bacterium]